MGGVVDSGASPSSQSRRGGQSGLAFAELGPGAQHHRILAAFARSRGWTELAETLRISSLFSARGGAVASAAREQCGANHDARSRVRGGGNRRLVRGGGISARKRHPIAQRVRWRG